MDTMSVTGYSDRINHALAFAAKHHAQQVWKGSSRVPYFSGPANVAIILTRYGQDDDRRKSAAAGLDHHLTKPVDIGHLLALIAASKSSCTM